MGRSPCCEKVGLKKGPWTPEEDQKLLAYIEKHGHGSWRALPAKAGLQRCGKSCRLRWTNYLRPDIKRGKFSLQEEQTIIQLHALLGNRWSAIATHLPKRTDNEIKNYWNTHLKKRLAKMGIDPVTHKPKSDNLCSADGRTHNDSNLSHMAQWESARLEAEARLAGEAKQVIQPYGSGLVNLGSSHLHQQVAKSVPTTIPVATTTTRPLCLDVLKAWQGFRARPTKCGAVFGHDLESPTSTLTFSENSSMPITAFGFGTDNINNPVAAATMEVIGNSSTTSTDHHQGGILSQDQCDDQDQEELKSCLIGYKDISMDYAANHHNDVVSVFGIDEEGHDDHPWSSLDSVKTEDDDDGHVVVPMTNFIDGFTDLLLGNSNNSNHLTQSSGGNSDDNSTEGGIGCDEYDQENKNYWNSILNLVNSSPSDSTVF